MGTKSPKREAQVNLRLTGKERKTVRDVAHKIGLSSQAWIRTLILAELNRHAKAA